MKKATIAAVLASLCMTALMSGCAESVGKFDASSAVTIYLVRCDKNETITLKNAEGEDDFDRLVDICSGNVKKDDKENISVTFGSSIITFESESGKTNLYPSSDAKYLAREKYDGDEIEYIKLSSSEAEDVIEILGTYGVVVE